MNSKQWTVKELGAEIWELVSSEDTKMQEIPKGWNDYRKKGNTNETKTPKGWYKKDAKLEARSWKLEAEKKLEVGR